MYLMGIAVLSALRRLTWAFTVTPFPLLSDLPLTRIDRHLAVYMTWWKASGPTGNPAAGVPLGEHLRGIVYTSIRSSAATI